jgi:hypothetical protein
MAGADLSPEAGPATDGAIHAYLRTLADGLTGPRSARAAIVDEIEDGLREAQAAYLARGLTPAAATEAALSELGEPRLVAAGFRAELAGASARRVGLSLLVTGPLVGLAWLLLGGMELGVTRRPPEGLGLFAGVLMVAVPAALLSIAATGRPTRWLPVGPRTAPTAASVAAVACVVGDAWLLAGLLTWLPGSGDRLIWPLLAVPITASLVRLSLAAAAARRCLAARALLT